MKALQYGTFVFLALGIIAAAFAGVVPVGLGPYFKAAIGAFAGLAGLCAHPPWAPSTTDPNQGGNNAPH